MEERKEIVLFQILHFNKSKTHLGGLDHKQLHRENNYQEEVGRIAVPPIPPPPTEDCGRKRKVGIEAAVGERCVSQQSQSCRQVD